MTPYKQAFVVTTENGAVSLAVVMAKTSTTGKQVAQDKVAAAEKCDAWDVCTYPMRAEMDEGIQRLLVTDPARDAAPYMLAVLRKAIDDWPTWDDQHEPVNGGDLVEWFGNWRTSALAAIAKAEGGKA